jgi:polyphosphate kinase
VKNIHEITLQDNIKARVLGSDGIYRNIDKRGKKPIQSQLYLYDITKQQVEEKQKTLQE